MMDGFALMTNVFMNVDIRQGSVSTPPDTNGLNYMRIAAYYQSWTALLIKI